MEDTLQGTNIPKIAKVSSSDGSHTESKSELHAKNSEENSKYGSGISEMDKRVSRELNGYVVNPYKRDDLIKKVEEEYKVYNEIKSIRPVGSIEVLNKEAKNVSSDKVQEERLKYLIKKEQEKIIKKKQIEVIKKPDEYEIKKQEARKKAEELEMLKKNSSVALKEAMRKKYAN